MILIVFAILIAAAFNTYAAEPFNCSKAPDGTIWCDDFEDDVPMAEKYFEYGDNDGDFVVMTNVGRDGSRGIRVRWQQGEIGAGGMKKSFGRTPSSYIGKHAVYTDQDFDEIYWRMDVMSQPGWTGGGPAKLSRALCMANSNWATGAMAHLWSKDNYLGMDPASGVSADGELVSTKYNDFENLRWLGFKQGTTDIYSAENSGRWYCIEGHIKLNTPGQSDGVFEFWIDDTLQAGTYNLNWHGAWNNNPDNYKINAVYFENYWNDGSPVEQERYFDNIVISTKRIGCACSDIKVNEQGADSPAMQLYPNPATEYITIDSGKEWQPCRLSVYNEIGEEIYSKMLNSRTATITTVGWPNGVYMIKCSCAKATQTGQFVKWE